MLLPKVPTQGRARWFSSTRNALALCLRIRRVFPRSETARKDCTQVKRRLTAFPSRVLQHLGLLIAFVLLMAANEFAAEHPVLTAVLVFAFSLPYLIASIVSGRANLLYATMLLGAVERGGQIRLRVDKRRPTKKVIHAFLDENVGDLDALYTDEHGAY
ncbi:hypothetical protein LCGC14_2462560, partial [marine sediment metagenome]